MYNKGDPVTCHNLGISVAREQSKGWLQTYLSDDGFMTILFRAETWTRVFLFTCEHIDHYQEFLPLFFFPFLFKHLIKKESCEHKWLAEIIYQTTFIATICNKWGRSSRSITKVKK